MGGRTSTARADAMLLTAAGLWGAAFIAQRAGMDHIGPMLFNALRYAIGAAVVIPIARVGLRRAGWRVDRGLMRDGAMLGLVLTGASGLQQYGMVHTTASRGGFITGLYALFVPMIGLAVGVRPTRGNLLGIALATGGMVLFAGTVSGPVAWGDWLVLGSAVMLALHIVMVGKLAPRRDPTALVTVQFVVAGVVSGVIAACSETIRPGSVLDAWIPVLFAGVFATGGAYTLQIIAQRDAPASHAVVLMSSEAGFAALFGWVLLDERLGAREWLGGALMFAGMLASQLIRPRPVIMAIGSDPTPAP